MRRCDKVYAPAVGGPTGGAHRGYRLTLGLAILGLIALTLILVGVTPRPANAAVPPVSIEPKLGFVFLGDIWVYDESTGEAQLSVKSHGSSLGQPSFSLNFGSRAYEERSFDGSSMHSNVTFEETYSSPYGTLAVHVIKDAQSPAVSPDGRYCLYERYDAGGSPVLHLYDSMSTDSLEIPGAWNGSWIGEATGESLLIIYNRNADTFPRNSGFFIRNIHSEDETPLSVKYPGETVDQSNAWAPQAGIGETGIMVTKYVEPNGSPQIALITGAGAVELADVSKQDSWDYRWLNGTNLFPGHLPVEPFVELVPALGGLSDIYSSGPTDVTPHSLTLRLEGCSFGWNASMPSESPFPDIHLGDPYYQAAAFMRVNQIISGFDDGTFGGGATSKRAQFAKMIAGALYLPAYDGMTLAPFTDLGADLSPLYPREYVSAAYQAGLIEGVDATHFDPFGTVTRAQVMTMVVRAAKAFAPAHLQKIPAGWVGHLSGFNDPTHGENAHIAEYNDLLGGIELTDWNPWAPATRGEMAQMLYNLMALRGPVVEPAPAG